MKYKIWLSYGDNISNLAKVRLIEEFKSASNLYWLPAEELRKRITDEKIYYGILKEREKDVDSLYNKFLETGISFTSIEDPKYPKALGNIYNPPYGIFYLGKLPDEKNVCVGIVGARGRSAYGSQISFEISRILAEHGVSIISGLANGIDSDGHKGAIAAKGKTYAVLGCGVDICYPKNNKYLYDQIIEAGGIISEYPPGSPPAKRNFPARNRIISGISDKLVVIEAREKSGSLITADFAMEQGKDVYALPGRITDKLSYGCNKLIAQGAYPIVGIEEFLTDILREKLDINCTTNHIVNKKLLEKDESLVYSLLDFQPQSLGTLLQRTNMNVSELLVVLQSLDNKGLSKELISNYYVKKM